MKRITVKIGSNVLTRKDGTLDVTRMSALVDQIAELHARGHQVVLVSSGAVASGRSELHLTKKMDSVDQRQLYSAVGQAKLINRYYELFREHHIAVGQVLTTKENFSTRRQYLNQRNCMTVMLENGVIPIVNENDTISVTELMFTDNDELSGLVASMMDANLLVLLSNIDGIYNGSPNDPASQVIPTVEHGRNLSAYISTEKSGFGRGGMITKCNTARKVADEGIEVVIANGKTDNILLQLMDNPHMVCTRFVPAQQSVSSVKKWIAHSSDFAKGAIKVNHDTAKALRGDKAVSILPIGVVEAVGQFEKDDIVKILSPDGVELGVGRVNCDAQKVKQTAGEHGHKPVVHYDWLYTD